MINLGTIAQPSYMKNESKKKKKKTRKPYIEGPRRTTGHRNTYWEGASINSEIFPKQEPEASGGSVGNQRLKGGRSGHPDQKLLIPEKRGV